MSRRGISLHFTRRENFRRQLNHAADGARRTNNVHDVIQHHRVLDTNQQTVFLQIRLDDLARPTRVVSLHQQEDDIEMPIEGRQVTQVIGIDLHMNVFVGHANRQSFGAHGFNMFGPLVDHRDVVAIADQICSDGTSVRTRAENGNFFAHWSSSPWSALAWPVSIACQQSNQMSSGKKGRDHFDHALSLTHPETI